MHFLQGHTQHKEHTIGELQAIYLEKKITITYLLLLTFYNLLQKREHMYKFTKNIHYKTNLNLVLILNIFGAVFAFFEKYFEHLFFLKFNKNIIYIIIVSHQ